MTRPLWRKLERPMEELKPKLKEMIVERLFLNVAPADIKDVPNRYPVL